MKTILIFLLMTISCFAQTTINGKVPGKLWRTNNVQGQVEVYHPWGRTTTLPINDAWVNVEGGSISIGARCDQPILDGTQRKDYHMAAHYGKYDSSTDIQVITKKETTGYTDEIEFKTVKTAIVVFKDGKPIFLYFTCVDHAMFDIDKALIDVSGKRLHKELREAVKGYKDGVRVTSFRAIFNNDVRND